MRAIFILFILNLLVTVCITGCLSGTGAAIISSSSGSGSNSQEAEVVPKDCPVPEPLQYNQGFISLPGSPIDVAVGNFSGDETGHQDVAVIYSSLQVVSLFVGDGNGDFTHSYDVELSSDAGDVMGIEEYPLSDNRSAILISTDETLELIQCPENGECTLVTTQLNPELFLRDMAVGDFNGDDQKDIAVTGDTDSTIEIFFVKETAGELNLERARQPLSGIVSRAITSADFNSDGFDDLVVQAVKNGLPAIQLFLSQGDGTFEFESELTDIDDANPDVHAEIEARNGVHFVEIEKDGTVDPAHETFPDIIVTRLNAASKVIVSQDSNSEKIILSRHDKPTGVLGRGFSDGTVLKLPKTKTGSPLWDVAALNLKDNVLQAAYSDNDGLEVSDDTIAFPIPGKARRFSVGDFNSDGFDDVVVISARPSVLSFLLSRNNIDTEDDEIPKPIKDPYEYKNGLRLGENLESQTIRDLQVGFAGLNKARPFIATILQRKLDVSELLIRYLDPTTGNKLDLNEKVILSDALVDGTLISVGDVNRDGFDDIVVVFEDGILHFVLNKGVTFNDSSPAFRRHSIRIDVKNIPAVGYKAIELLVNGEFDKIEISNLVIQDLDGNDQPELVLPFTTNNEEENEQENEEDNENRQFPEMPELYERDFVLVIKNLDIENFQSNPNKERSIKAVLLQTFDDPKHCAVAEVNGDGDLDIIVACKGGTDSGNKVDILFGEPDVPSGFERKISGEIISLEVKLKEGQTPDDPDLEGRFITSKPQVERVFVPPGNDSERIDFFITSNSVSVSFYKNLTTDIDNPEIAFPIKIFEGSDPETILFTQLGKDPDSPNFDLIVLDEDAPKTDKVVPLELEGDLDNTGSESPWVKNCSVSFIGAPGSGGSLKLEGSSEMLHIINAKRTTEMVFFRVDNNCLDEISGLLIDFKIEDQAGDLNSFSHHLTSDHLFVGSIVEDKNIDNDFNAIDVLQIPRTVEISDLVQLDESSATRSRISFPQLENLNMLALGEFQSGLGKPDIILVEPNTSNDSSTVHILKNEFVVDGKLDPLLVKDHLLSLRAIKARMNDRLLVMTKNQVEIVDPTNLAVESLYSSIEGMIQEVAYGAYDATIEDSKRPFFVKDNSKLFKAQVGEAPIFIAENVSGKFTVGDFDDDSIEDVLCIDIDANSEAGTFSLFLGPDFSSVQHIPVGELSSIAKVITTDVNLDTFNDIQIATKEGEILTYYGNGCGEFPIQSSSYAGPKLESFYSVDINGDGLNEIIASVGVPGLIFLTPN